MECPRCRNPLREGARFCTACGFMTAELSVETERIIPRVTGEEDARITSDPFVNRTLDSKYELTARLGEGGMGAVYRARRLHIGDEVAVKVLHERSHLDSSAAERFRREARSAALIGHPNVVTIHDFREAGDDGSPAYIVMELVKGTSLRGLLRREGRLEQERAASLMLDVCAGVGAAHRQGVVHRDLKPDNVIVVPPTVGGEREVAKVVDFGIAKLRDLDSQFTLTQAGVVVGTPYYMSPEQCQGESSDARADVYSLGAMLYEMLAGVPPFRAGNLAGLIVKHLNEAAQPFAPDLKVGAELERVCLRALSKKPEERQADALQLHGELRAALAAGRSSDLEPPESVSELKTLRAEQSSAPATHAQAGRTRRRAVLAGLFVILLFTAVAVPFVLYTMSSRNEGRTNPDDALTAGERTPDAPPANAAASEQATTAQDLAQVLSTETGAAGDGEGAADNAESDRSSTSQTAGDLRGEWAGTYGPMNQPATLRIEQKAGGGFNAVLRQGAVRVECIFSVNTSTRQVTIKETRVISGDGWSLGENTGTLSADGKTMSGTGADEFGAQLGMSYKWSFSRR